MSSLASYIAKFRKCLHKIIRAEKKFRNSAKNINWLGNGISTFFGLFNAKNFFNYLYGCTYLIIIFEQIQLQVTILNIDNLNRVISFKYSYLTPIILSQLYGLKYRFLFNNCLLFGQLYGFKYSYLIRMIYTPFYIFQYFKLLYGFK